MSQAGHLVLINASMNGNLKEVQALLAAGAYMETKDEVGGWVGRGGGTFKGGAGRACVHEADKIRYEGDKIILMPSLCTAWRDGPHPGRKT